jgi:type VI secretion system protein ImpF
MAGERQSASFARASLLDRLVDENPKAIREPKPFRVQDRGQLRESLRRDLEWLLNTRCPRPERELVWTDRGTLDYGVPDFGTFFTANPEDWRRIAEIVAKTVRIYEPRLRQVRVETLPSKDIKEVSIVLSGVLTVDGMEEPVSFPVRISRRGESAEARFL